MPDEEPSAEIVVPRVMLNLPDGSAPDVYLSHDDSPVDQPLVADLILMYAFDKPTCFTLVNQRDLTRLGLDKTQLHEIAVANLRRVIPQPELREIVSGVFMLTCGGHFEATALLLDEVWQQVSAMVEGDLTVSVPARDVVIFTGNQNRDGLTTMRTKVSRILKVGDHSLTRHFLVRAGNRWGVYEGFAA